MHSQYCIKNIEFILHIQQCINIEPIVIIKHLIINMKTILIELIHFQIKI